MLKTEIVFPKNSIDFAHIALIIIILKFSANSETYLPGLEPYRLNDENDVLLKFVMKLLESANYLERTSLTSLQALFMFRIFKKFNFKDGDGGDGSRGNILFAICLEMGYTLGLNQNIDILYKDKSQNYRTVLKNLWKHLLEYDTINSFDRGVPLHVSEHCLRKDLLDSNDITIKTILKKREVLNIFLSPKFVYNDIRDIINEVTNFIDQNFKAVFELIQDFENASNLEESFNALHQFVLSFSLITILQHGYSLLYNEFKESNESLASRFHSLGTKYTTLMTISSAELYKRIVTSSMDLSSTRSANQIHNFIAGMMHQWLVRIFIFYFFLLVTYAKAHKFLSFKSSTDNYISLRLSELVNFNKELTDYPNKGISNATSIISLHVIMSRYINMLICLGPNKCESDKIATNVQNYTFFIINATFNHIKPLIAQDDDFKSVVNFDQNNLLIVYDAIQESFPSQGYIAENFTTSRSLDVFGDYENATVEDINVDIYDFLLM